MNDIIAANRKAFICELRNGGHKIGTQKSDEKGYPIFESEADRDGSCACAIMGMMFGNVNGKISLPTAVKRLGLSSVDCSR